MKKMKIELDRRRKYYLILDCETATLPESYDYSEIEKGKIALAKPLIYDIGWIITDKNGKIYRKRNFLISETFCNYSVFRTAYYVNKRSLYIKKLVSHEIELMNWHKVVEILEKDLSLCEGVGAYNAMFDFKKAIPYTDTFFQNFYSDNWEKWYSSQVEIIKRIAAGEKLINSKFNADYFELRGKNYPLFDIWGIACEFLLNNTDYKEICIKNGWLTTSGKYFKTSAECAFRFCESKDDFIESHTALNDAEIETKIFSKAVKKNKNKVKFGLQFFPFRILGTVKDFH